MGRKIIKLIVIGTIGFAAYSQVVDPATQIQLTELNITQKSALAKQFEEVGVYSQMLDLQTKISDANENFAWAKGLKSIKRLKALLEQMVCLTNEMEFYLGISDDFGCVGNIEYQMALLDLQASMDFIAVAVGAAALSMSPDGRIRSINDAIDRLEQSIEMIRRFNQRVEWGLLKTLNHNWGEDQINPMFDISRR